MLCIHLVINSINISNVTADTRLLIGLLIGNTSSIILLCIVIAFRRVQEIKLDTLIIKVHVYIEHAYEWLGSSPAILDKLLRTLNDLDASPESPQHPG